ncbi:unnamed protein product [Thelazia callipaeda]|uniref:26S proteasome non-ATPase regulatory subunit 8 n=1 Tax=Thelazia callipaeda TaxID=103827 RepID=A0A0N5D7M6_THECL|nr:unnamed protein product [Thelazia callipaeda]
MEMEWKKLMADWKKENKNLESIGLKLKQLKELMNNADALRGLSHETIILIHRDVFEIEVLYAILRSDLDSFQQAINVVLSFYKSYSSSEKWPNKWLMIGLNLMYLLATNQHPEFHMLLEQIDEEIQQNNPYIHIPLTLEQSVMEGAYHKILLTKKNIPSPYYTLFMHMSMNTIREEIAACVESAFIQITQRDAAKLLLFNDVHELMPFAEKVILTCW